VGLDVHADSIAVAVAEHGRAGEVRSLGTIPNRSESVRKLVQKLGGAKGLRACYEAGPTGYALYWQLAKLGVECEVVAPSLVPTKAGERVKTDRRDAIKLARCHRAGELTAVWVPDPAHEALRDLVRAREAAKKDQLRARHRLGKFLLRAGRRQPEKTTRGASSMWSGSAHIDSSTRRSKQRWWTISAKSTTSWTHPSTRGGHRRRHTRPAHRETGQWIGCASPAVLPAGRRGYDVDLPQRWHSSMTNGMRFARAARINVRCAGVGSNTRSHSSHGTFAVVLRAMHQS
jgi:hypothetical protein